MTFKYLKNKCNKINRLIITNVLLVNMEFLNDWIQKG